MAKPDDIAIAARQRIGREPPDVVYDVREGRPMDVRPQGSQAPHLACVPEAGSEPEAPPAGFFHHPYAFIPAIPGRPAAEDLAEPAAELGDRPPMDHDRYHVGKWTGSLRVRMVVETPLLLPDAAAAYGAGHRTQPVRLRPDGSPLVASTAVKGMLRSAYEAVTNSRMGVFSGHDRRLAFRQDAREAKDMWPVIVRAGQVRFVEAARLRRYVKKEVTPKTWRRDRAEEPGIMLVYNDPPRREPQHGDDAWASLDTRARSVPAVVEIAWHRQALTQRGRTQVHGWVWVSNDNIERKQYERFFFDLDQPDAVRARLSNHLVRRWGTIRSLPPQAVPEQAGKDWYELLKDYADSANPGIADQRPRKQPLDDCVETPDGRRENAFSRHVLAPPGDLDGPEPVLAFARLDAARRITGLFPVHISRELHPESPRRLLDESLRPAVDRAHLSPADRVFGWVGAREAHRGQFRVGPVRWRPPSGGDPPAGGPSRPVRSLVPPLPLAVLSGPKPQQARFYLGQLADGSVIAQAPGADRRAAGYRDPEHRHLRGRKVYPHQVGQPDEYWLDPRAAVARGQRPEYLREAGGTGTPVEDHQNQSVEGWIEPGAEFEFELHVVNLSDVELGALLWLLQLPAGSCLRLGAGKPLGFGSVRVELLSQHLETGDDVRARYASLATQPTPQRADGAEAAFRQAVEDAYRCPFEQTPFIAAFRRAVVGIRGPIHYPRLPRRIDVGQAPEGYEWFVANEQEGEHHSLPDLARGGPSLPYVRPRKDAGRGGNR
jgi:CRISPR-associated protein (TIGR03986 family)